MTNKTILNALSSAAGSAVGEAGLNVEDVFSTHLYVGNQTDRHVKNGINLGEAQGSGSVELNGVDQSLYVAQDDVFNIGTSDFTIEFFINADVYTGDAFTVGIVSNYAGYLTGFYVSSGTIYAYYRTGEVTMYPLSGSGSLTAGQWHHVALVRHGQNFNMYLDGTSVATGVDTDPIYNSAYGFFTIGEYIVSAGNKLDGYISNVRFSSTARYTSTFTPPTSNFTSDSNTILLTCVGDKTDLSPNGLTVYERGSNVQTSLFGPHNATEPADGGLVWIKWRDEIQSNSLFDTERGPTKYLFSDTTDSEYTFPSNALSTFTPIGFTMPAASYFNGNGGKYASWTWRKAPKFFDCVTYTGDGTSNRQISHNINGTVGTIIIKRFDSTGNWLVWHRSVDPGYGILDLTGAFVSGSNGFFDAVTDTYFETSWLNTSGATYVAYLFAHNDGDGEFGPNGDADIIKCGSYTGNGSTDGTEVDLGFEPQWVLIKSSSANYNWQIYDNMRGVSTGGNDEYLIPNSNGTEGGFEALEFNSTGFKLKATGNVINGSGQTYIYMAIRRGPMAVPTDANEVFDVSGYSGAGAGQFVPTGFPVDTTLVKCRSNASTSTEVWDRVRSTKPYLFTDSTAADGTAFSNPQWLIDDMDGFTWAAADGYSNSAGRTYITWNWRRAPKFFDVVGYTGDGIAGLTVSHNLGVAPEMIWVKDRDNTFKWTVYHKDAIASGTVAESSHLTLNDTSAVANGGYVMWNNTAPTDTNFYLGDNGRVNLYNDTYIAYLFASLDGVSKVGSYTGNGTSQTIDCGFSSGARFVLIKQIDTSGTNWFVFDSYRGIVSGNDPALRLNTTDEEATTEDAIDPVAGGFSVTNSGGFIDTNNSGGTYIYYAIA